MLSILVCNAKGGCGKTTIATNLAAAFALGGHRVLLADADRQGSAGEWARRRAAGLTPIATLDWSREAGDVPSGVARLVIDAPAGIRSKTMEDLLARADLVVTPVLPSPFDEAATASFLRRLEEVKSVRKGRVPVLVVGNRVRPQTRAAARLDGFLASSGHTVVTRLRDTALYPEAAAVGLSIFDFKEGRVAQFRADWAPLLSYIEEGAL